MASFLSQGERYCLSLGRKGEKQIVIKKITGIILILLLMFGQILSIGVLNAQEVTPESTATPTPGQQQTDVTQNAAVDNSSTSEANTGGNTIGPTPTPTPTPEESPAVAPDETSLTPTPTPKTDPAPVATESGITATQSAQITNTTKSTANTGGNIQQPSGQSSSTVSENSRPESSSPSAVTSGNAASVTAIENVVNEISINSEIVYHTINIFVDTNATLNLSNPEGFVTSLLTGHESEPVINVAITSVNQNAVVSNDVQSVANTGNNAITTEDGGSIETGSAVTLASMLNRINFVMIDSVIHVVVINIFGNLTGDIILPGPPDGVPASDCMECIGSVSINQDATVSNTVTATSNTGNNTLTTGATGMTTTGNAANIVHISNFINTALIGTKWFSLFINPYGYWDGSFLGWEDIAPTGGGQLALSGNPDITSGAGCPTCTGSISIDSNASVSNNVTATANTGGNTVQGREGSVKTGSAYNAVSIINFVNAAFIRSFGFWGIINIFGSWKGNVGDAASFLTEELPAIGGVDVTTVQTQNASEQKGRDSGGLLSITNNNNVGSFVYPGDTVTFFVTMKNVGSGTVYDAVLDLDLLYDGEFVGGAQYTIGNIDVGKGKKITTGLTLSTKALGGLYTARATVKGHVGPNNDTVSAIADSLFTIVASLAVTAQQGESEQIPVPSVMGSTYQKPTEPNILKALVVLLLLIPAYLTMKLTRERHYLRMAFSRQLAFSTRLRALQLFLL